MDDFLFVGTAGSGMCDAALSYMKSLCEVLGVPLAPEKTVLPTTRLEFLGITLDTVEFTMSIPPSKIKDLLDYFTYFANRSEAYKRDILSLAGRLSWCTKCVPAGRIFLRRILDLAKSARRLDQKIKLNRAFFADLDWWKEFLPQWNGRASFLSPTWTNATSMDLFTDASGAIGCGAIFGTRWCQVLWPEWVIHLSPPIAWMELVPIYLACSLWGASWSTLRLTFHSDNESIVLAWRKQSSAHRGVMDLIRRIHLQAALGNYTVRIIHIPGCQNGAADAVSRNDLPRFRSLHPSADCFTQDATEHLAALRTELENSSPSLIELSTACVSDYNEAIDVSHWQITSDLV